MRPRDQQAPQLIFPSTFEEQLGFPQVRAELRHLCQNEGGLFLLERMSFMQEGRELHLALEQLDEMMRLATSAAEVPSFYYAPLREHLSRIAPQDSYLLEEALLALRQLLESVVASRHLLVSTGEEVSEYPHLSELGTKLQDLVELRRRLHNLIDEEGEIKDNASRELREIRSEIRQLEASQGSSMQSILRQAQVAGWVEKDAQPTMRDGRLLLPVIPSAKREIGGIVHDESATGRTIYVEPPQLVVISNKLREKRSEERREIIRLLKEFTNYVRRDLDAIKRNCMVIGTLDFLYAKSKLAESMAAIVPPLASDAREMEWQVARHPLLEAHLREQGRQLVPLTLRLSEESRIIVISGPNAGGKSVALKTVGLLQYMLQCGLAVPMMEHSKCLLFDKIFLDIGDAQSMENDLSTYSSHLQSMKQVMRYATPRSLILIDEFGSGTEPAIGGAIAEGLLEQLRIRGSYGLITTHYGNLKDYTEKHEGVTNGAMLFDRGRIEPLYELYIGQAGSSFAIEIARKIGLPKEILEYAEQLVGSDYMQQDKYLQDIIRDKAYWKRKRPAIRQKERSIEEKEQALEEKLEALQERRRGMLNAAEREALAIVSDANAMVERTIREIKQAKAEKEETQKARQKLQSKRQELEKKERKQVAQKKSSIETGVIEPGMRVTIVGGNEVGEVLSIERKRARIQIGLMTMTVKLDRLRPTDREVRKPTKQVPPTIVQEQANERRLSFKPQIDLRGKRVEEALPLVIQLVDDAVHFGYSPIRILHGTGTGALKEAIRQLLSNHPLVKNFYDERVDLGGAGITIVEL